MRTLLWLSLLTSSLAVAGSPRRPVVALLPSASDAPEVTALGVLIEARAAELLEASAKYSLLHAKQVAAMVDQEGLNPISLSEPEAAATARAVLGADRVVTVVLEKTDTGSNLLGAIVDGKRPTTFTAKLPADWPSALRQGSEAIARAVLAQDKGSLPKKVSAQPDSSSEKALQALGRCYVPVVRQSLGVEAPVTVLGEVLDGATADCREALTADATLTFAQATLALAQAIVGDDAEAATTLTSLGEKQEAFEPYTLARFWLVTRYQSNEAGVAFLRDAAKKHPGELVLRSYLGDLLGALGQHEQALQVWQEYLALAPQSAFAQGRVSRALARLGKHDDAIAAAKQAVTLAPAGRDAKLQLASRFIDAGQLDDAIATLTPLATGAGARPEQVLRLGWATWLKGDVDGAAKLFQAAVDATKNQPAQWRTRGRALYNLALVEAKRGKPDAATKAYQASLDTEFRVKQVDPSLAAI
ncbi:MAG: tetratricopeptide repeat protein, partial [Myxococcaceae bacterium]|nr:tetratricopeptide repeat protein [Myxococcaceae bacterium]